MRGESQSLRLQTFAFVILFTGICLSANITLAKKEEAPKPAPAAEKKEEPAADETPKASSGKGTNFADKERNTEKLEAIRKRVRRDEMILRRNMVIPAATTAPIRTIERPAAPKEAPRERSPREKLLDTLLEKPMDKSSLSALKLYLSTSTNTLEKASLGTAYCLGCFATDQGAEGSRMSALMRNAYPKDENVKLLSLETFVSECRKCGGTGEVNTKCSKCKGKKKCRFLGCRDGTMSNPDFRIAGKFPNCPQCGGTAKCPTCEGTGTGKARCQDCSGRGKKLEKKSVEKGYIHFLRHIDP